MVSKNRRTRPNKSLAPSAAEASPPTSDPVLPDWRPDLPDLPLASPWQLYLHFRSEPGSYKQAFLPFGTAFDSIGAFWSHFNALPAPSAAFTPPRQMGAQGQALKAFSLFVGGVDPTWEDPVNAVGGEVFCRCHLEVPVLDEIWLTLVLACVGARLPGVVGVRAVDNSFRGVKDTQSKIEVWYPAEQQAEDVTRLVTDVLAETLPTQVPKFEHQSHEDKSTMERKFMSSLKRSSKKGRSDRR